MARTKNGVKAKKINTVSNLIANNGNNNNFTARFLAWRRR